MKRTLSLFLILTLCLSLTPISAFAAEEGSAAADTEVAFTGDDSVGGVIANTLDGAAEEEKRLTASGGISDITMEGSTATVRFSAGCEADLVVAVYEEGESLRMLGSGLARVTSEDNVEAVAIQIDSMPQYYVVGAFLLDAHTHEPLCDEYMSSYYTSAFQDFLSKSAEDFENAGERVLELDEQPDTNFLVFSDSAVMLTETAGQNTLTDNGDGTYTITNADERVRAMQPGTPFSYTYADGTVLVLLAQAVYVNGTTVTLTEKEDVQLEDIFSYVRIEGTNENAEQTVTPAYPGVTPVDSLEGADVDGLQLDGAWADTEASFSQSIAASLNIPIGEHVKITGGVEFSYTFDLRVYISPEWSYIRQELRSEIKGTFGFTGELEVEFPIAYLAFAPIPCVTCSLTPMLVLEAEASITFTITSSSVSGFEYDSEIGRNSLDSAPQTSYSVEFEGKLFVGLKLELAVTVVSEDILKISLEGRVGFEIIMHSTLWEGEEDQDIQHTCDRCYEGEVWVRLDLKFKIKAIFDVIDIEATLLDLGYKIKDFYYSVGEGREELGLGHCPYKRFLVTVTVRDINGDPMRDMTVRGLPGSAPTDENGVTSAYLPAGTHTLGVSRGIYAASRKVTVGEAAKRVTLRMVDMLTVNAGQVMDSGRCGEDLTYKFYENGLVIIEGTGPMYDYDDSSNRSPWYSNSGVRRVYIKEGATTVSHYAFYDCDLLRSIDLPEGIVMLGQYSFANCDMLLRADLPGTLDAGDYAFEECRRLEEVTFGEGVTEIGVHMFYGCDVLRSVELPSTLREIRDWAFEYCELLSDFEIPEGVTKIGEGAFEACYAFTTIDFPSTLKTIGDGAFGGCIHLESVTIPEGVTSIGWAAFSSCSRLTSVTLPDGIERVGESAFSHCPQLESVRLPSDMTEIPYYMFEYCTSLTAIDLPEGLEIIRSGAFGNTGLTSIDLPDTLRSIETGAFSGTNLTSVVIPSGVTEVSGFGGCQQLASVTLPASVTTIGWGAFEGCYSLTQIDLPSAVTVIGDHAFSDCGITSIDLPSGLETIDSYAFVRTAITSVTLPASLRYIGESAFEQSQLTSVTIPAGVETVGNNAFINTPLTSVTIASPDTELGDNVFGDCRELTSVSLPQGLETIGRGWFQGCDALSSIQLPSTVTYIDEWAFFGTGLTELAAPAPLTAIGERAFGSCADLTSVTLPASVTEIGVASFAGCLEMTSFSAPGLRVMGRYAFSECVKLADVSLPASMTSIGENAFEICTSLETIVLPRDVQIIGNAAFTGCTALRNVTMPERAITMGGSVFSTCTSLERLQLPEGIELVDGGLFWHDDALREVYIPASVTEIWGAVFEYCGLTDVYYGGSESQWAAITIGDRNSELSSAAIHYNCTGLPAPDGTQSLNTDAAPETPVDEPAPESAPAPIDTPAAVPEPVSEPAPEPELTPEPTPAPEPEPEPEAEPEDAPAEDGEIVLAAMYTGLVSDEDGARLASFSGLRPGERYVFIVSIGTEDAMLEPEALLFIAQGKADENGSLAFSYVPRLSDSDAERTAWGRYNGVYGDATSDTEVMADDVSRLLRYAAGEETPDLNTFSALDVDGDGELTETDAYLLLDRIAGRIETFPVE